MRKALVIGVLTLFIFNIFLFTIPQGIKADSPYQAQVGEDYLKEAYDLEALVKAKAGRKTSNSTDGVAWNNRTWDHSEYFTGEHMLHGNNYLASYNSTNVSVSGNTITVSTGNDNFDDGVIGSMWTEVDAANYVSEGTTGNNSLYISQATLQSYIYKEDWEDLNNYSLRQKRYTRDYGATATSSFGGFVIYNGTEDLSSQNDNWQIGILIKYSSYDLQMKVFYRNTTGSIVTWTTYKLSDYWTSQIDITYSVEYDANNITVFFTDHYDGYSEKLSVISRTDVMGGTLSYRKIAIGGPTTYDYFDNYNKGCEYYNYTQENGPTNGWFESIAIATGNTDTAFKSMSWTGGPSTIQLQTANDRLFKYPSAWHTIESGTDYSSSSWSGAYMRWNVSLTAGQAFVPTSFYSYGSCTGIYINTSEASTTIDRNTTVYGRSITLSHNILVHPDSLSSTMFSDEVTLEIQHSELDMVSTYYIDPDKNGDRPCHINIRNTTLKNDNASGNGFVYCRWENGDDYYVTFENISSYGFVCLAYTNYPSTYWFFNVTDSTLVQYGPNTISVDLFNRNKVYGGYNGSANQSKWLGVSCRFAKYNWIDSYLGGNGLVFSHNEVTLNGEEYGNISFNYVNRANYVALGSYGGDVTIPFSPSGVRNGTLTFWKNYVNNTRLNPVAGIGYALSFGYGEENSTFKHCYVFNTAANITAASYIHHASANCSVVDCVFYNIGSDGVHFSDESIYSNVWGNKFIDVAGTAVYYSTGVDYAHNMMGNNTFIWCNGTQAVYIGDLGFQTGNETFIQCNSTYSYNVADNASLSIFNSVMAWDSIDSGNWNSYVYNYKRFSIRLAEPGTRIILTNETDATIIDVVMSSRTYRKYVLATEVVNDTYANHTYKVKVMIYLPNPKVTADGVDVPFVSGDNYVQFKVILGKNYEVMKESMFQPGVDAIIFIASTMNYIFPILLLVLLVIGAAKMREFARQR